MLSLKIGCSRNYIILPISTSILVPHHEFTTRRYNGEAHGVAMNSEQQRRSPLKIPIFKINNNPSVTNIMTDFPNDCR